MSQCDRILERLKKGFMVTPRSAYYLFGTLALHSRISELRGRGYRINCRLIRMFGKRVGCYTLAGRKGV